MKNTSRKEVPSFCVRFTSPEQKEQFLTAYKRLNFRSQQHWFEEMVKETLQKTRSQ